jgi:hypothetical protein
MRAKRLFKASLAEMNAEKNRFVFFWTDSVTGKGTKVYVESEAERDELLQHYFETSIGSVKGVLYNPMPIKWPGVISRRLA